MARSLIIKTLAPGLVERGKIKIGEKGKMVTSAKGAKFQPPQKLDHFIITTTERGPDGNFLRDEAAHAVLGDAPTRIPVRLLYDDVELNYQSRFVAYEGRTLVRVCDGEICELRDDTSREEVPCLCAGKDPFADGVCKPASVLSVVLDINDSNSALGGVWKFRSTSYNTARGLLASLLLIQRVSGGLLAGIPLDLVVGPKQVANPKDGKQQTIYVVHMEYRGGIEDLQNFGHQLAAQNASRLAQIRQIEVNARAMLTAPDLDIDDEDTVPEFFPEQAAPPPNSVSLDILPPESERLATGMTGKADPLASARRPAPAQELTPDVTPDVPAPAPAPKLMSVFHADGSVHSNHTGVRSWLTAFEELAATADKKMGSEIIRQNALAIKAVDVRGLFSDRLNRVMDALNGELPAAQKSATDDEDVF